MTQSIAKVTLSTFDALTDINKDHFALFVDSDEDDYILIKEFARGSATITASNTVPYEITHNLGYIPFFLVYAFFEDHLGGAPVSDKWMLIQHIQVTATVPYFYVYADTSKIYIWNFDDAATPSDTDFKWYIFYDNVVGSGAQTISESDFVFKISKPTVDALTSVDPNDYIAHSDLNSLKTLKEGTASVTYTANGVYTVAHGLASYSPTSMILFIKFPDGYVVMSNGNGRVVSRDRKWAISYSYVDATNVGFHITRFSGTDTALNIKYYIFETPL